MKKPIKGVSRMRRQAGFTVIIERDPETGWYVGEVVELPGCYTEASDLPALDRNVREAVSVYLKESKGAAPGGQFVGTWRLEASR